MPVIAAPEIPPPPSTLQSCDKVRARLSLWRFRWSGSEELGCPAVAVEQSWAHWGTFPRQMLAVSRSPSPRGCPSLPTERGGCQVKL